MSVKPQPLLIRDATTDDLDEIGRLNAEWKHVTSTLTAKTLERLHATAIYHRVCVDDSHVVAFLLAFGPGEEYESPNYRWFDAGVDDFIYIDRIVVDHGQQGAGVGRMLYGDLIDFARSHGAKRLACEVDIKPLNAQSDGFHTRQGFIEVGTQWVAGKRVSLRELGLAAHVT